MTHAQIVQRKVGEFQIRVRLLLTQQGACLGLIVALVASLLLVAATRFRWWTNAVDYIWLVVLVGGLAGAAYGWMRRVPPGAAAFLADDRAGLRERLSTAIELVERGDRDGVAEAQIADAARHAEGLRPGQVLPWRPPPHFRYLGLAAAVLMGAIYLPDLPMWQSPQERADREAMKTQGTRIQAVAKQIEKELKQAENDDSSAEIMQKIARNLKQLGKEQEKGRISKKQAMLQLNDLMKQLEEAEKQRTGGQPEKALDQVAGDLRRQASNQAERGNQAAAQALQQMAENLEKRDFAGAQKQLEELAKKLQSGELNSQDARKSAEMLRQMADAMTGSGLDEAGKQLREAAEKLAETGQKVQDLERQLAQATTEQQRRELREQMAQEMQQGMSQAAQSCQQAGGT